MKYTFDGRDGDQIEFLDAKQTANADMAGAQAPTPTPANVNPAAVDPALASMQKQLNDLTAALVASGKVLPAPDPADASMTLTNEADYSPDKATIEQEETTDPFAS
jgi:hypothetical protein